MAMPYRRIGDPFPLKSNTCASCGFLATTSDGISYQSVGEPVRVEGGFGDEASVVCAERQIDLPFLVRFHSISEQAKLDAVDPGNAGNEFAARIATLQELIRTDRGESSDRPCSNWVNWNPLLSPREHRDAADRLYRIAREDRRDEQMARREDARDVTANRRHITDLWVLGGLVAIATIVGSVIQSCATLKAARITQPPIAPPAISSPVPTGPLELPGRVP